MRAAKSAISAAVLVGAFLTGCTYQPEVVDPAPEAPADAPTVDVTPEPAASMGQFTQSVPLTDVDGYTMTVDVSHTVLNATNDPSGDVPGVTSLFLTIDDAFAITNTTPARDLEFEAVRGMTSPQNLPFFGLFQGWNAGSPVCQVTITDPDSAGADCITMLSYGRINSIVPADTSVPLDMHAGRFNGSASPGMAGVPEGSATDLLAALPNPDFYFLAYAAQDWERFPNVCEDKASPSSAGLRVVWTSTGTCNDMAWITQPG